MLQAGLPALASVAAEEWLTLAHPSPLLPTVHPHSHLHEVQQLVCPEVAGNSTHLPKHLICLNKGLSIPFQQWIWNQVPALTPA